MVDLLDLNSYDYYLPQELIAQYPLKDRSSSRLMHIDRKTGTISHLYFRDLVDLLAPGEVLVINNSKVIPARLFGYKDNGTKIEILLLNHLEGSKWKCMVHPGKRLKREQVLRFSPQLEGWVSLPDEDGLRVIEFNNPDTYWNEIERIGHIPLPPYIKREDKAEDRQTYQTVYAEEAGSVAAPTAGFHFTEEMLSQLKEKGIKIVNIILHIGMGTFVPIKTQRIDQHKMHSEFCTIPEETANVINKAKLEGRRVIAVGSTSIRTLESFWNNGILMSGSKWTDIFIYPGKNIQVADALITNFHLPKSTLLMMVSAFAGYELTRKAYEIAVQEHYRFFSYGGCDVYIMKTKLLYPLLDNTMNEYQRLTQFCTGTHQWIIRAREQKEGRGREDRFWYSPEGGLWMTFDIYYDDFIPTFPLFIAYCLHSLLLELFPLENLSIKWPNDIMWKDKKLGGILCEHNESEKKYIIGLGLNTNVSQDAIDGKLDIVTLSSLIGFPVSNEYLSDLIIANIYKKKDLLKNPKFYLNYINLWLYGLNQLAQVQLDNKIVTGINIGVAEDGTLLLKDREGDIHKINYGSLNYIPDL